MPKLKNITLALLCICLLSFCKRSPTTWEDDVVAPLATGSLSLANLFPDTVIKANADSSLKIAFETALINFQLDSLIKIPDTTIVINDTNAYFPSKLPGGQNSIFSNPTIPATYYNLPNGIQLRKAIVRQGTVNIKLYNSYRQPLLYEYQLPSATKNGIALDTTFYIPGATSASVPGLKICSINLAGYDIDFTGPLHNATNQLMQGGNLSTAPNAVTDTLFVHQGLRGYFSFTGMVPQYATGYFGNQSITVGPDTTSFAGLSSIKKGLLNLNSANVSLKISNQFGVAMKATISQLSSINTYNPSTVNLTTTNGALSNLIVSPGFDNNGPNNPVINISPGILTTSLNNGNSNVKDFLGNLPNKLSFKLKAQINPFNNQGGNNDFGYYGTSFSANLSLDVPLYFAASNLMLADTVSLNVSNVSQLQNVNKGNLILTATNQYPFSIYLSAVLLDENKHPIDNLFSSPSLIEAPLLDVNGKVISPLKSKLFIPLNPQKIANVQKARYVSYSATFNTANQPTQVKFYSNYTLNLLLTADINYTIGK